MQTLKLMAVGDTGPTNKTGRNVFQNSILTLKKADIRFANVERIYTRLGTRNEAFGGDNGRHDPMFVEDYVKTGFNVVSLASNHSMDWGADALLDCRENFRKLGIATIGTGANLADARKPVVFDRNGVKVAFLAYCSVLIPASWATNTRAGVNPIRARTYYQPYDFHPATPVHICSIAEDEDIDTMKEDITFAKEIADVVVVSMHWGVHFVPGYIADYEVQAGHAAIEAGCDLILGSHPHLLKGAEVYRGKPIMYSLGNFALEESPEESMGLTDMMGNKRMMKLLYSIELGPSLKYRDKQYWGDTGIVEANLTKDGVVELEFLPVQMEAGRQTLLNRNQPKFEEIVEFLKWSSKRFNTTWELNGDRLALRL